MSCAFLSDGRAAVTCLAAIAAEAGDFNRDCMEFKVALIPRQTLEAGLGG